jgi:RIO kinase 1
MKVPDSLTPLVEQGLIQEVIRPLRSGKEAQIYLVLVDGEERVAKVYKDATNRSFKHRSQYTEGRTVRNPRDQRAMRKQTNYGKKRDESEWRSTEADIIYRLHAAEVTVPVPYNFVENVLIMELVRDAEGKPAPRLADTQPSPAEAKVIFDQLLAETVRMLCAGVVHGDLSEFNVLMSATGPVIIDFPQAVDPAKNRNAKRILFRDIENLERILAKRARRQRHTRYGQEIWHLYEKQLLTPDTHLTGRAPKKPSVGGDSILAEMEALDRAARERRAALGLPPPRARTAIFRPQVTVKKPVDTGDRPAATKSSGRRRRRNKSPAPAAGAGGQATSPHGPARGPKRSGPAVASNAEAKPTSAAKPRSGRRRRRRRPGKSGQD